MNPARPNWAVSLCCFLFAALAPAASGQSAQDCLICHGNRELSITRRGKTVALFVDDARLKGSAHALLGCADCHRGLRADSLPHAKVLKPVNCVACHESGGFEESAHGPVAQCKTCHGSHEIQSVKDPRSAVNQANVPVTCGQCHSEELRQFSQSAHGGPAAGSRSPTCVGCHGAHNTLSSKNPASPVFKSREARLCLKCHLENPEVQKQVGYSAGFIASYEKSVHGVALATGNLKSASCGDCHGSHNLRKPSDPSSLVHKGNIARTCSRCHSEVAAVYNDSIHGRALKRGNMDAPTCTSCHGEHEILARSNPRSPVSPANVSIQVCAACHNSVQLNQKYGMPSQQFDSFQDSFHGLAARAGSVEVANCASCHGIHNIKPSWDPTSTVHKSNLVATCGRCHPGAGKNFARGTVHVVIGRDSGPVVLYWVRAIYVFLIIGIVGCMFLHNLLDFLRRTRYRFAVRQGKITPGSAGSGQFVRMTLNARLQHAATLISFIILVITGFMLKFPDAWWVVPIRQISEQYFVVRGLLHRIAGTVLIGVSVWHIGYLFTKEGRRFVRDIGPRFKDVRDFRANIRYLAGLSKDRPRFGRFGYAEKAEYWALVWGVVIMGGTGIVMWFNNFFISLFTKLGWDISRTIHFYEACLASLAIVVWHFYFVMLNPDAYPMSTTWITGKISEQEMAEEHPLELEQLR